MEGGRGYRNHACVQIQFKDPSTEIGRLLRNMISNVKLKLVISNVKAD